MDGNCRSPFFSAFTAFRTDPHVSLSLLKQQAGQLWAAVGSGDKKYALGLDFIGYFKRGRSSWQWQFIDRESSLARNAYLRCKILPCPHQYGAARHVGLFKEEGHIIHRLLTMPNVEIHLPYPG